MTDTARRHHTFQIDGALLATGLDIRTAALAATDARFSQTPMAEEDIERQALQAGLNSKQALATLIQEALTVGLAQLAPDVQIAGLTMVAPSTSEDARFNYPDAYPS